MAAKAQQVVLLLAASDVTLLRVQVPPLSAARLKAALPNLVEDRLIADPSSCAVVAGGISGGLRSVAVMQRDWLNFLANTLTASGARRIAALPAQLCLPCHPGSVTVSIGEQGSCIDMLLRFSEHEGVGLAIGHEPHEAPAQEALRTLCAMVPEAPVTLYVPQAAVHAYQEAISHAAELNKRTHVSADSWAHWIDGANGVALDLMAGSDTGDIRGIDWRAWRWPMGLAAAVVLINTIALNVDWWRMKSEAGSLRAAMTQIYKSAYPKETVILDPVAQMRQRIAAAKRSSGVPAPDDFTALLASFGEAWGSAMPGKSAIDALEYRDGSLFVRLKPVLSRVEGPNVEVPAQQIKTALAERGLSLDLGSFELAPAQPAATWKIRSIK